MPDVLVDGAHLDALYAPDRVVAACAMKPLCAPPAFFRTPVGPPCGRSFPGRPKQPLQWIATAVAVAAVVGLHALVVDQFSAWVRRKLAA